MKFREDGTFHILQFADIQEIPDVSEDTLRLMNAALERARPDLVVLSGDQLKGADRRFSEKGERAEETIRRIMKPVTDRKIPFAVTFGDQDRGCGLPNEEEMEIYRSLPGCVDWLNSRGQEIHHGTREGTFAIGVRSSDESRVAMAVYLFDTGAELPQGGYQPLPPGDLFWYRGVRDAFAEKNGGPVPGIVFQHMPLPEYYRLLKRTDRRTKGAVRAYRTHAGEYYLRIRQGAEREGFWRQSACRIRPAENLKPCMSWETFLRFTAGMITGTAWWEGGLAWIWDIHPPAASMIMETA